MRAVQFESDLNLAEAINLCKRESEKLAEFKAEHEHEDLASAVGGVECVKTPVSLLAALLHLMQAVDATLDVMGVEVPDEEESK